MASEKEILRAGTPEEQHTFRWLRRSAKLVYLDEFLFFPLRLGGINLGYIPVNFYVRSGASPVGPLGWRVRPRPTGTERSREERFITMQEQASTVDIVRVESSEALRRTNRTLRRAMTGEEVGRP